MVLGVEVLILGFRMSSLEVNDRMIFFAHHHSGVIWSTESVHGEVTGLNVVACVQRLVAFVARPHCEKELDDSLVMVVVMVSGGFVRQRGYYKSCFGGIAGTQCLDTLCNQTTRNSHGSSVERRARDAME